MPQIVLSRKKNSRFDYTNFQLKFEVKTAARTIFKPLANN
jgi:hypothetical protein